MKKRMKKGTKKSESGIALLMAILALMVLSAIAVGLIYMTTTETLVNSNYRSQQVAYFAAKAGIEEARDRMIQNTSSPYYFAKMTPNPLPTQIPSDANPLPQVLYILNEGNAPGSVQPWAAQVNGQPNPYMDDELCHDGYALAFQSAGVVPDPGVHCSPGQLPSSVSWYNSVPSQLPFSGTSATLSYKWVRVALKLNGSVQNYLVDGVGAPPIIPPPPASQPVCYDGSTELALTGVVITPTSDIAAACKAMTIVVNGVVTPHPGTPVYLLTALGVSSTGARKMVQADVALNPSSAFNYGLFGTGTACADVSFTGNGGTDSYDGSLGPYGSSLPGGGTNSTSTGGNIGSNGNVSLGGNGSIGGSIGVLPGPGGTITEGPCPGSNYTVSGGNAGMVPDPNNVLTPLNQAVQFMAPPAPVPLPPTTSVNYSKPTSLVPGTYGNVSLSGSGVLTLAPGVYNLNSLSMAGQSGIVITPQGQVVLNIAGTNVSGDVVKLAGQSVTNQALNANDFQINYGGTGTMNITGATGVSGSSYFIVNAPKAAISITGQGDIYGAVLGATITDSGQGGFHYDRSASLAPVSTGALQIISFRHVPY